MFKTVNILPANET